VTSIENQSWVSIHVYVVPSVDFLGQNELIGTTLGVNNLFLTCLYVSQTKILLKMCGYLYNALFNILI
jgi:hypothetical protein